MAGTDTQDRVAQAGVVAHAERGQHCATRKRAYQPLAFERCPYRRIAQPGGVSRGDKYIAEVCKTLASRLAEQGFAADVTGRAKHLYSV